MVSATTLRDLVLKQKYICIYDQFQIIVNIVKKSITMCAAKDNSGQNNSFLTLKKNNFQFGRNNHFLAKKII